MSQPDIQSTVRRGISTRSVVLVILLVGLGAGAVGYGPNNAFAATNPSQQSTATNGQWPGLRGAGPAGWNHEGGPSLRMRTSRTGTNRTATGPASAARHPVPITVAYHGIGN